MNLTNMFRVIGRHKALLIFGILAAFGAVLTQVLNLVLVGLVLLFLYGNGSAPTATTAPATSVAGASR